MTSPAPVAVVLPCRNARHLLWRSLASVAAQSLPPAQILVLDRASIDGTAEWLRVRWPGVQLYNVAADSDAAAINQAITATVSAPKVAMLRPGEHWRPNHLEALAAHSRTPGLLATDGVVATLSCSADEEPVGSAQALADAVASLPPAGDAILLDLRAASEPAGLLDMLGLAASVGAQGRMPRAFTLADLSWAALQMVPAATPLLINLGAPLDLRRAGEQLCVEELAGRAHDRPVRLIVCGLGPSPPRLRSRRIEAVTAHPDLELGVSDAVSGRYAPSLLERRRARLVPPPMLSLAVDLRELGLRQLIEP